MKTKSALIGIALLVIFPVFLPYIAHADFKTPNVWSPDILKGPLVTCTGDGSNGTTACTSLCDLIYTFINVVYFGIGVVLWIFTPIFFAISGIMFLIAGANPDMVSRARKTMTGTLVGVLIVLGSWLILNTFISVLGIQGVGGFGTSVCNIASPPTSTTTTGT